MNRIFFIFNFILLFSALLYGCLSGNIAKNIEKEKEGQRILVKIYNNFPNVILEKSLFRYIDIDLVLKGNKNEYFEFFVKDGYIPIDNDTLCKNGNSIKLSNVFDNVNLSYRYNSKICY